MAKIQGKAKSTFIWKRQVYKKGQTIVVDCESQKEVESIKQLLDNPKAIQTTN